jgi:molybdopterin molybdotransferase
MISVTEAQKIVLNHAESLPPEKCALTPSVLGRILAEDIASDIDMPPYDKSMMDGYAVRSEDLPDGRGGLTIIEEITAGNTPKLALGQGQAARIMTGAPIPSGCDAVVVIERTQSADGNRVQINDSLVKAGQNILFRGREMRRGEIVLSAGTTLRPQELGTLATVGRTSVSLFPRPRVAVLPTGDEIVEGSEIPGPGQIRNGNGPMLMAQVARAGGVPRFLGIARDTEESLRSHITDGLQDPLLILSGGVSAGKLDLVPAVLRSFNVEGHFHKVSMKPGKPIFFGTRNGQLIFGLPGNPVSSLVCFELFVRPAIRRLMGQPVPGPQIVSASLAEDFRYKTDRPTYHPAWLEANKAAWRVRAVPWFGSPDLRGVADSNAFVLFPEGDHHHRAGQVLPVLVVESCLAL